MMSARAGADTAGWTARGGTGAAPQPHSRQRGHPHQAGLAAVDERLRREGIRSTVNLPRGLSGTLRNAADVVRAVALGADAVSIGSAALIAMGCHQWRLRKRPLQLRGIATSGPTCGPA